MTEKKHGPTPDVSNDAVERRSRAQLFEAADLAYRRAGTMGDPDLDAWVSALADGVPK
jgi:hypothetical protein